MNPKSSYSTPSRITMLSGFAIIISTTLGMGALTQDQSGDALVDAASAFRSQCHGPSEESEIIPVHVLRDKQSNPRPEWKPWFPMAERAIAADQDRTDEFANLLLELERVAGDALVSPPFLEYSVDFNRSGVDSQIDTLDQAAKFMESVATPFGSTHFEVRHWASSPTKSAWIQSTQTANELRDRLQFQLRENNLHETTVTSSAAIWPHADRLRPEVTILVRRTISDQDGASLPAR